VSQAWAERFVDLITLYLGFGGVFAVAFALRGAQRLDPAAREASWGFRLLLVPGAAALWPLLAWRWLRGRDTPPIERTAHREASR
jgi:hypothetical protein